MTLLLTLTSISCQKESVSNKESEKCNEIMFQVMASDISVTKSEVSLTNIPSITVYAKKNGINLLLPEIAKKINNPQVEGAIWPLGADWGTSETDFYHFHAYTYQPTEWRNPIDQSITITQEGTSVTITQPKTQYWDTYDYLLSYLVDYPEDKKASINKPVVPITLEHALSKVSVEVIRKRPTKNLTICFEGLQRDAKITCKNPETEPWNYLPIGQRTCTYTYKEDQEKTASGSTEEVMSFIAFPASGTMDNYTLTITCTITDQSDNQDKTYTTSYKLSNTNKWESGHHITYIVTLDDQIHLTGSIHDWVHVDFIEGTILPQPEPKPNPDPNPVQ